MDVLIPKNTAMSLYECSDEDLLSQLEVALDDSTSSRDLTDWEINFIENILGRDSLSEKQRDCLITILKKLDK